MTIELRGIITNEGNFTGEILGQEIERFWLDTTIGEILDMFGVIQDKGIRTTIIFISEPLKAAEAVAYWDFRNKYNI